VKISLPTSFDWNRKMDRRYLFKTNIDIQATKQSIYQPELKKEKKMYTGAVGTVQYFGMNCLLHVLTFL
jgi:hypothetical protein